MISNGKDQKSTMLGGKITCIKVTKDTRQKLTDLGKKGDTYEMVINQLLANNCNEITESDDDS